MAGSGYYVTSSRAVFVDSNSSCQNGGVSSERQIFTGNKTSKPPFLCSAPSTSVGGDKTFVYEQLTPVTSVTISHNLEKYASATILDLLGSEIWGSVIYIDINTVTLEFSEAISFTVIFN